MDNQNENGKWRKRAQIVAYIQAGILFFLFVVLASSVLRSFILFNVALFNGRIRISDKLFFVANNPTEFVLGIGILETMKYAFYIEVIAGIWVLSGLFKSLDPDTPPEIAERKASLWKTLNSFCLLTEGAAIVILLNPLVIPGLPSGYFDGVMLSTIIVGIHTAFILIVSEFIRELEAALEAERGTPSPPPSSADEADEDEAESGVDDE